MKHHASPAGPRLERCVLKDPQPVEDGAEGGFRFSCLILGELDFTIATGTDCHEQLLGAA
jgi:hypothetical protein